MKTFLIQNLDYDFCWHLVKAVKYQNWFYGEKQYDYIMADMWNDWTTEKDIIPIGSLEFVFKFLDKIPEPINIPEELMTDKFLKRYCYYGSKDDININHPWFIKSTTKHKSFTDIINCMSYDKVPDDDYLISEVVDIESEWRIFVFNGQLVGLNNYVGDFTKFPNVKLIKEMINTYKTSPKAYTIDVGINNNGTFIIEVHPFVSCGLYGFSNYRILPQMFISGFREFIN